MGERRLSPDDQRALERLRGGLRLKLLAPGAAYIALWALLPAIFPDPAPTPMVAQVSGFLAFTGIVLGLALAVLATRDTWRESRDLERDLRVGLVERFAPLDPTTFEESPVLIEVRRPSGRVLTGPADQVGRRAPIREVAPGPIVQFRVEEPADGLPPGARLERRHLAPEERLELQHAIRHIERVSGVDLVLLLWMALCLAGWQTAGRPRSLEALLQIGQGVLAGGIFLWRQVGNRVIAHRLRGDLECGYALVFVPPAPEQEAEEVALPVSRLSWSLAGRPAEWRGSRELRRGL